MKELFIVLAALLPIIGGILKWYGGKAKQNEEKKQEIHEGVHSDDDSDFLDQF